MVTITQTRAFTLHLTESEGRLLKDALQNPIGGQDVEEQLEWMQLRQELFDILCDHVGDN